MPRLVLDQEFVSSETKQKGLDMYTDITVCLAWVRTVKRALLPIFGLAFC